MTNLLTDHTKGYPQAIVYIEQVGLYYALYARGPILHVLRNIKDIPGMVAMPTHSLLVVLVFICDCVVKKTGSLKMAALGCV